MTSATQPRNTSQTALAALLGALSLGLLGDALFKGSPAPGINVILWLAVFAWVARAVARTAPDTTHGRSRWLLTAIGFASCLAIRDAEVLRQFNLLAVLLAFGLASLAWFAPDQLRARLQDIVRAGFHTFASFWTGPFRLAAETDWRRLRGGSSRLKPVLLGLFLATPVVLVFGALFSSADPAFARISGSLFSVDVEPVIEHTLIIGALAWFTAGMMRAWIWKVGTPEHPAPSTQPPTLSAPTIAIVLGAMAAVFLLFVALQARYLFGGEATIRAVAGLGYADYARQGFFEMVAATGLVIPILYGADVLLPDTSRVRGLRILGGVQLVLTACVCASAVSRMAMYVGAYGLTEDRIVASAILAWLGALLVLFALTVLRGRRERFCYGAIVAGFVTLGGLNAANPDQLIARVNVTRAAEGREVDVENLVRLGADAAPYLVRHAATLPAAERCRVLATVRNKWAGMPTDWRSWNGARSRARVVANAVPAQDDCVS